MLFKPANNTKPPLAARLRPTVINEFIGQEHLLSKEKTLKSAIDSGAVHSMIFWGPPGVGKTTLAKIIANQTQHHFIELSAVLAGVKELRLAMNEASYHQQRGQQTILFIDEIHRFNKSQQDSLLAPIEDGLIILIGATTENPSFELNNALLSRVRVYVLESIKSKQLIQLINTALQDKQKGLGDLSVTIDPEASEIIAINADGDARRCLNMLEIAAEMASAHESKLINKKLVNQLLQFNPKRFDNKGDIFYEQISALHKSVRGTDPDAAIYWLTRMLDGGCDPSYIGRRMIRMASEDIGNADPRALEISLNAVNAYDRLGSPEGELALAQAIIYLACAPKSNAVYNAYNMVKKEIMNSGSLDVPNHLRNAPTKLMNELGYGKEYRYPHDYPNAHVTGETYLPEGLIGKRFYLPTERGLELKIKSKLEFLKGIIE